MPRLSLLSYTGTSSGHIHAGDSNSRSCKILTDTCHPLFMRDLQGPPGGLLKAKVQRHAGASIPGGVAVGVASKQLLPAFINRTITGIVSFLKIFKINGHLVAVLKC